jgi:hypothetical protein
MYSEELDIAALIAEEEGQDCALKSFPLPILSGLTQALDPNILAALGVVVWGPSSGFSQRFSGGGERSLEC